MDPADRDDVAAQADGDVAGTVQLDDGSEMPVVFDADLADKARDAGVDLDRLRAAAAPADATVDLTARTDGDTTSTIPVQSTRQTDLTNRRKRSRDYQYIQDDQIQRLLNQGVNYTERVGDFLLERDDLIPTVKERLKALIVGEDGMGVEAEDPDDDEDQRLADHLDDKYENDVRPTQVIDVILRENMMNSRAVLRSTDLKELDLNDLDYLQDGISGEEIYIQDRSTVYTFELDESDSDTGDDAIPGIDLETKTLDPQPLVIGEHVFDISLYDSPPLEAVADTAVNKMVMQRLKARKAEITAFGAVYAKVEPPSYLPESQYFDRVQDEDWDGEGQPPTKLERAMKQNIQSAFDTLKDFQSGTVMSVPDFWNLEQLDIPETDDPIDDQIRGYNRDISRRLLVPLDLIELQSGSELSRETMFATLMTTIAGWRREIKRVFDQYAEVQAEIEGINGDVTHTFPPLKDANTKRVISALKHAGIAGLTQKEVRQMMNTVQGVDLETEEGEMPAPDGSPPTEGGPDDPDDRQQQMEQMLQDQRRGPGQDGQQDGQQGGQQAANAAAVEATTQTLRAAGAAVTDQDGERDVDFDLDFPLHTQPNVPSRVDVQTVQSVKGGRLALPPVPKTAISADSLEDRINRMVAKVAPTDDGIDSLPMAARVADSPPDHQPFVDITGPMPVDVLETVVSALPDEYMTLYQSAQAADADGSDTFETERMSGGWDPNDHPRGPDGKFIGVDVGGDVAEALSGVIDTFQNTDDIDSSDTFHDDIRQKKRGQAGDAVRMEKGLLGDQTTWGVIRDDSDSGGSSDYIVETQDGDTIDTGEQAIDGWSITHIARDPEAVQQEREELRERRRQEREKTDAIMDELGLTAPGRTGSGIDADSLPEDTPDAFADALTKPSMAGVSFDAEVADSVSAPWKPTSELGDIESKPNVTANVDATDFLNIQAAIGTDGPGTDSKDAWLRDANADDVRTFERILNGEEEPRGDGIPLPVIEIGANGQPTGFQEGRHRAIAAVLAGEERIPVRIAFNSGKDGSVTRPAKAAKPGVSDPAAAILRRVPFFPDPNSVEGDITLTRNNLQNWLAWVKAGRPKAEAFDPALHPRGPDGQFVERPYDIPDSVWDTVDQLDGGNVLNDLVAAGELDDSELNTLLQDPAINIDDVPKDVNSAEDLRSRIEEGDSPLLNPPEDGDDGGDVPEGGTLADVAVDDTRFADRPINNVQKGDVVQVADDDGNMRVGQVTRRPPDHHRNLGVTLADGTEVEADAFGMGDTQTIKQSFTPDGSFTGPAGSQTAFPGLEDVDDGDPRFDIASRHDVSEGDIVKGMQPGANGREPYVGEVEAVRYEGAEVAVRTQDGDLLDVDINSDSTITEAIQKDSPLFTVDPSADDPEDGRWLDGMTNAESGDIVRFDKGDGPEIGRVSDESFDSATVVQPDGNVTNIQSDDLLGVFEGASDRTSDDFATIDDRQTVNLMERDGSPSDVREGIDRGTMLSDEPLTEADVKEEVIPKGAFIAREFGEDDRLMTVGKVTGYDTDYRDRPVVRFEKSDGGTGEVRAGRIESRGWKPYKPRDKPEVSLELEDGAAWDDPDTPRAYKSRAIKSALDHTLPKFENHPEATASEDLPMDDDTFEKTKEQMSKELAKAHSQEHVETVIARMTAVGDDKGRASASPDATRFEGHRTQFQVAEDESESTIVHELGHSVGMAYGHTGGSNDQDGKTYPMPSFKWNADDVLDKYGAQTPPDHPTADSQSRAWNQGAFALSDWTDEVDDQVGNGLDGRNFTKVDYDDRMNEDSRLDDIFAEGSMVRLEDEPSFGEPQNFEVVDQRIDDVGERVVTLRNRNGDEHEATVNMRLNGRVKVSWTANSDYISSDTVGGTRKSVPDNWLEDPLDADSVLGTQDFDDHESAVEHLADTVNKAWYRQAAASRELGQKEAAKYNLISGYSAKQGHETWSRIHEVMREDGVKASEQVEAARSLLKFHPDLLEAYQAVYEPSTRMKQALNQVALREDIGHRWDVPSPETPGEMPDGPVLDAVRDLYDEDGGDA